MDRRLELRFSVLSGILLALFLATLGFFAFDHAQKVRAAEARAKAQLVVNSIARTLERAAAVGIPLDAPIGLEELIESRHKENPEIQSLKISQPNMASHGTVAATVVLQGQTLAVVSASLNPVPVLQTALPILALALALLIAGTSAAHESFRFVFRRGPQSRAAATDRMMEAIAAGKLDQVFRGVHHGAGDPRNEKLIAQVRAINESSTRLVRLIRSLRATEPDAERRASLAKLLADSQGHFQFSNGRPSLIRENSVMSDGRWLIVLTGSIIGLARGISGGVLELLWLLPFGLLIGGGLAHTLLRHIPAERMTMYGIFVLLASIPAPYLVSGSVGIGLSRILGGLALALVACSCSNAARYLNREHHWTPWAPAVVAGLEISGLLFGTILRPLAGEYGYFAGFIISIALIVTWLSVRSTHIAWRSRPIPLGSGLHDWSSHLAALLSGLIWSCLWGSALLLVDRLDYETRPLLTITIAMTIAIGSLLGQLPRLKFIPWLAIPAGLILAMPSWPMPNLCLGIGVLLLTAGAWHSRRIIWSQLRPRLATEILAATIGLLAINQLAHGGTTTLPWLVAIASLALLVLQFILPVLRTPYRR
ncbi:hypothetical protein [Parachitinimonas caeni]|uniref:Uncharacterized protein n=1 Tax=Parachitinimonas caeni TaxID=3031301 RepID=A0ABT7DVI8_9NEIS|nr:hypothetical protein [Parachitinimonas caeni]MDK2124081.1 hypothetical protein [Parachitinimonas caeni]